VVIYVLSDNGLLLLFLYNSGKNMLHESNTFIHSLIILIIKFFAHMVIEATKSSPCHKLHIPK